MRFCTGAYKLVACFFCGRSIEITLKFPFCFHVRGEGPHPSLRLSAVFVFSIDCFLSGASGDGRGGLAWLELQGHFRQGLCTGIFFAVSNEVGRYLVIEMYW